MTAVTEAEEEEGLNPCSNGIWDNRYTRGADVVKATVLILVLMEFGITFCIPANKRFYRV